MLTDPQERRSPDTTSSAEANTFKTLHQNYTDESGMISGRGKYHSNKHGNTPYLRVSLADVRSMVDNPPSVDKDQAQWLIPSTLDTRVHAEQEAHGEFWLLWADVDWKALAPKPMAEVASVVHGLIGGDFEIYASRSATEDRQKCRVLIPLNDPLRGADWIMSQRVLNRLLADAGIEPDSASEGAGQLLYLPNRGQWYHSISRREGVCFAPVSAWADRIADLRRHDTEAAAAVLAARDAARKRREAFGEANVGQGSQSLIGAFNATCTVEDILEQAGYDQRGKHFRHPNSETGSFSASVKDGRVHTLSSADPLYTGGGGGGAHDAFSAFQVLFHQGDIGVALRDAGDKWLTIGAESWNEVSRRKFVKDRQADRDAGPGVEQQEPEARHEFEYNLNEVPWVEYGIDGFTSTGLTVIAGEAGLGKTSTIVPMAATVAHLLAGDPDDPFSLAPTLRRKVIYVTEDAGQVHRLLYGLRHHRSQASNQEFREWFYVFEAHRKSPSELAADIRRWRERYSYSAGPELNHYVIEPLIVVDTSNANIDLENENDNAEVGKAIAAIKQALDGRGMVWLLAHLAKSITKADIKLMSVRGASAWVGDVNATAYLISEANLEGKRFLVLGKRRFEAEFSELEVKSEVFSYHTTTPWGQRQSLRYMVCDLKGLADKERMAVQVAKAMSETYAKKIIAALNSAYQATPEGQWRGLKGGDIEEAVTGKHANIRAALIELVNAGKLMAEKKGSGKTKPTFYWLPEQNRAEVTSDAKGRSRSETNPKSPPEIEPLAGCESAEIVSPPHREGAKGAKLEDEDWPSPIPMANPSASNVPAGWLEV